jgi:hypothetical protein
VLSETQGAPARQRVRVRKKRKRRPIRRWGGWWLVLPILLGALVFAGAVTALLARDVVVVRDALVATQDELRAVQRALGSADMDAAEQRLLAADQELAVARARSRGPLWSLAGAVPVAGRPILLVRALVDVATDATGLTTVAVQEGGALLADGIDIRVEDGQVDLTLLEGAAELLALLPADPLARSTAALAAADPGGSPQVVLEARDLVLELAVDTLDLVERTDALLSALPGFLGVNEPRRYFVGVQTSGELRGTGGLVGFFLVLVIDDGRFSIDGVDVYEGLEDVEGGPDDSVPVSQVGVLGRGGEADAPADFAGRYAINGATSQFNNVNLDPDLPVVAEVALDLYEERTGEVLDGLILLDAIGFQAVLEATRTDLTLPDRVVQETGREPVIPAAEAARFTTIDIYELYGSGFGRQRKELLADLGADAFARVFAGGWDGVRVATTIAEAAADRHLQVYSRDPQEQRSFGAVRAIGAFADAPPMGDRLAVTANNAVGGKQDVHLGHRFEVEVELGAVRLDDDPGPAVTRQTTVRTTLVNPLGPTGLDEYIIGNCPVGEGRNRCFEGPPGWNRTWWSVWTAPDELVVATDGDDGPVVPWPDTMHGLRVLDHTQETAPRSESWFELTLEGDVALEVDGDDLSYRWNWWRQAKAIPDLLDVVIVAPPGYEVVDASLEGVGSGVGLLGVDADAEPAQLEVTGDRVRLHGAVSRDTSVTLRLAAPT